MLVFGHTHKPWVHDYGGVRFVNCGSVGKPKDGDPRGAFAVLTATADGVAVAIERVEYDAEAVAREVRDAGLPASSPTSCSSPPNPHAGGVPTARDEGARRALWMTDGPAGCLHRR